MAYTGSASDRLASVQAAIDRCLNSQSYSIRGRSQVMAQLATLREMEKELLEEVNMAADGGSMSSLGVFLPPT